MTRKPHIVLGISGGIAAYKSAELVRLFVKEDMDVRVVMTKAGTQFITPLTLQTLSGHPVLLNLFGPEVTGPAPAAPSLPEAPLPYAPDETPSGGIDHIDIIKEADLMVVAPATADILAKAAHGIADDALTTVLLAAGPRVFFAPAMNHRMWNHPATQASVALLRERGAVIIEPGAGYQACGETGVGRMAELAEILAVVRSALERRRDLAGLRVTVTAGRTEEPVDPVRVLTNRSSGRMGVALAEEARDRGAAVTFVSGVLAVPPPGGVEVIDTPTARDMLAAVRRHFRSTDVLVMAAAVADFRPATPRKQKIKKAEGLGAIALEPTEDILKSVAAARRPDQMVIGFALETTADMAGARSKLRDKKLDLVVLNNPTEPGSEFGGSTNRVTLIPARGKAEELPLLSKRQVAAALFDRVAAQMKGRGRKR